MTNLDFAELERNRFGDRGPAALTAETLGRMMAYCWELYGPENTGDWAIRLSKKLLSSQDIPGPITSIIHMENRVDGQHIEELTQLVVGAQSSGTVGRVNPDTVRTLTKIDATQAHVLLLSYQDDFPEVVDWIKRATEEIASEA